MKLSQIGLAVNEIGRARELMGIIVRYGLQDWVSRHGLGKHFVTKKRLAFIEQYNQWERIRMAVEEMGPTFIKFGQILADRPDILPDELRTEMKKLQDEADPMSDKIAIQAIEKELRRPLREVFREFDEKRLASASIAQTYRAMMLNGTEVCVKIQRPGIQKKIELDLHLMHYFATRMQKSNAEMEALNVVGIVDEFGKTMRKELDFRNEAANIRRFGHDFENSPDIIVPEVYMAYTTQQILVEDFIRGIKVSSIEELTGSGYNLEALARKAVRLVFDQIFKNGFFHADPHPGNLFVGEGGTLAFIDFGMMGSLRREHLNFLGRYVLGYLERDPEMMTEALLLVSGIKHFARFGELEHQIEDLLAQYRYLTIDEMDFSRIMNESVDILIRYGLRIPPSIYLLVKALMSIERVAFTLNPKIDFAREMQPYAIELIAQQLNPKRFAKEVFSSIKEYYRLLTGLPSDLSEIIYRIKTGKFRTQIDIKGFEPLVEHIDSSSNRISVAIVLAALIIGASIISQWERLRWVGSVIFLLAGIMGFWFLIKLMRKNRF